MSDTSPRPKRPAYLDPAALASIARVDLRARRAVDGFLQGQHRSPSQGASVEFAQHRPYVAGDDLRRLDWKVYARTDKLHLKQYQRETNLDLVVLVDASASMRYRSSASPWTKYDAAATLGASLVKLALDQRDRAAVWLYDAALTATTRGSNAPGHLLDCADVLQRGAPVDQAETDASAPTDLARVFEQVHARLQRRAVVVVIGDLFDDAGALERGLARLRAARHDVLIVQTLDPAELTFDFRDATEFVGLETGARLPADPAALRQAYLDALQTHLHAVQHATRRLGFDYLLHATDQPVGPALAAFIARRSAALSKSR